MKTRSRNILLGAGAIVVVGAVFGIGSAALGQSGPVGPPGSTPRPMPTALATPGPGQSVKEIYPPAQSVPDGTPVISEADATQIADAAAAAYSGPRIPENPSTGPTIARQMSLAEAREFVPAIGLDGVVDDGRPVWVVTVHKKMLGGGAPPGPDGPNPAKLYSVYSIVIDGYTRWPIAIGPGSEALTSK